MDKKNWIGSALLGVAALIWGSSFVVMKDAVDFMPPFTLLWVRFSIATICTGMLFYKYIKQITKRHLLIGAMIGAFLFSGYTLQTWGLSLTTPSKNAFLTAIYCAMIPFLVWLFYKKRPDIYNFIAAIFSLIGIGLVSLSGDLHIQLGDILTIAGGLFFALHILSIKRYTKDIHPIILTIVQFAYTAIYSFIGAILFEDISVVTMLSGDTIYQMLYLSLCATTMTLLCQNIGQKAVSECTAAIILSLESVFGVIFSLFMYGEHITISMLFGFICIFIAIVISETKLSFIKRRSSHYEETNNSMS